VSRRKASRVSRTVKTQRSLAHPARRTAGRVRLGRIAVRRALLDAATELFSEQGPKAVSVRQIAAHAGVNHGLVHRHFGSKEALLRAVLDDLAANILREAQGTGDANDAKARPFFELADRALEALRRHPAYFRVLARAVLDGDRTTEIQSSFPLVSRLVELARRAQAEGDIAEHVDVAAVVGVTVATALGGLLFEPYLTASTGTNPGVLASVRQQILQRWLHTSFA
jgi:TetR/AcrR family transcriptional regulator, repressor for neighboring sulfatase